MSQPINIAFKRQREFAEDKNLTQYLLDFRPSATMQRPER